MAIQNIHSFLVHPGKHATKQEVVSGTEIPLSGRLHEMLTEVHDRSASECNIEIVFRHNEAGEQNNECRDEVVAYLGDPGIPSGRIIGERLQRVTTNRSGLGLLFLIKSFTPGREHVLVISRFPADQGIVAQEDAKRLSVEYLERVFMRNARAYKSVRYATTSLATGFWEGRAVDRQISGPRDTSEYWIGDFLLSELRTTSRAGTKRLADAVRAAVNGTNNLDLKHELISAASLMRGQHGRTASARSLIRRLGLSPAAADAIQRHFPRDELFSEPFRLDAEEFNRHALYRAVELNTGALMVAEDSRFEEVFRPERLVAENRVRYVAEGQVINEKLKKTK